jgi:hypothetical protein
MKLVKEHIILEKFTDDSDPISDMGIGTQSQIKKWFDSVGISSKYYTIDDQMYIHVRGNLDLEGTRITELPNNLRSVKGFLDLDGTTITKLPDNLSVGGNLYLYNTAIAKLPNNLSVGGDLYLQGTAITKLPKNLKVNCNIYKDF